MYRPQRASPSQYRIGRRRRGFTLLDTGLGTIIIGLGIVSTLQLLGKLTASQGDGQDLTIAVNLANNVHELTFNLHFTDPIAPTHWGPEAGETLATYNDNDDFDGATFSPPIDARRQAVPNLAGWTQSISVRSVDQNNLTATVPNGSTPAERIIVTVSHLGQVVYQESWLNVYPY
jgi:type II secretory pathway pseudopilin PulG